MKKSLIARIATITGLALGAFALSAIAGNWTQPLSAPPTCVSGNPGCDAPINVGASPQVKNGSLTVNAFTALLNSYFAGNVGIGISTPTTKLDVEGTSPGIFKLVDTTQGAGKVLTTVNGDGVASWQSLPPSQPSQQDPLNQLCNTGSSGISENIDIRVSTKINGKDICEDNNGCSLTVWDRTSALPEGVDLLGQSGDGSSNLASDYIRLRQDPDTHRWVESKSHDRGTNGNSSLDQIVTLWGGGDAAINDDKTGDTDDPAHDFWLLDNSGGYGYTMTICDY